MAYGWERVIEPKLADCSRPAHVFGMDKLIEVARAVAIAGLAWLAGYYLTYGGWSPWFMTGHGLAIVTAHQEQVAASAVMVGHGLAALSLALSLWRWRRA